MGSPEILQPGTAVRVLCSGGRTKENVVWEDLGSVVMVCARDQFERLKGGYQAPMPIGFRRDDVLPASRGR
jgi:hypothetical protein